MPNEAKKSLRKPHCRVCGFQGGDIEKELVDLGHYGPACQHCRDRVIAFGPAAVSDVDREIGMAIQAFRRPEVGDDGWRTVAEGWEPLAYGIIDRWFMWPKGLKRSGDHDELGWDIACWLAEQSELQRLDNAKAALGAAMMIAQRVGAYLYTHPGVPDAQEGAAS